MTLKNSAEDNQMHEITSEQQAEQVANEHHMRIEKVMRMKGGKHESWPANKTISATCRQVVDEFQDGQTKRYQIAGRLLSVRAHGKTVFGHLQDRTGKIQIYIKKDEVGDEQFNFFAKQIDIADIVWVDGTSFRTKLGEITVQVVAFSLLSKSLYPLADKYHGIVDREIKYRQRYLDLISSAESRERFMNRSRIITTIRYVLDAHAFVEVETPMLHPIPGGAAAKPFVTHHNALDMQLFLRIAPELYLKKLVIGGMERVYEINRCFRNEGISTKHNPEFTSVEYYMAYQDYHAMMDLTEEIIKSCVRIVHPELHLAFTSYVLDFSRPFARVAMIDAVAQALECSVNDLSEKNIFNQLSLHNITLKPDQATWGYALYALFEAFVEHTLIQPTFITHFPVEVSPLSKRNSENFMIVDRFELFIAGMELSNGFSELNDPFDQADRFADQAKARSAGDQEAHYYDADFITALQHGLPPTVGAGIGIDRLVMLITNAPSIRDVILFPTLKQLKS